LGVDALLAGGEGAELKVEIRLRGPEERVSPRQKGVNE
jgi:hypothetical protein